jgi:hypothetical protein
MFACGRSRETLGDPRSLGPRADDRMEEELKRPDRRRRLIPLAAMIAAGVILTTGWAWLGCPL